MNLKPELLTALVALGVTEDELTLLSGRMLGAVTGLQATLVSLDSQLSSLYAQREAVLVELNQANTTVAKLINMTPPLEGN